jgi:hypothetical protein
MLGMQCRSVPKVFLEKRALLIDNAPLSRVTSICTHYTNNMEMTRDIEANGNSLFVNAMSLGAYILT